jgi:hypothetical protein
MKHIHQRYNGKFLTTQGLYVTVDCTLEELGIPVTESEYWFGLHLLISDIVAWSEAENEDDTITEFGYTRVYLGCGQVFVIKEEYEVFSQFMEEKR